MWIPISCPCSVEARSAGSSSQRPATTTPQLRISRGLLAHRVVVLVELQEIVDVFRIEASLVDLLRAKIKEATLTKRPLTFPLRQPVKGGITSVSEASLGGQR